MYIKHNNLLWAAAIFLAFLFMGCPEKPVSFEELPPAAATGSISGKITNTSSVGISGATVTTNPATSTVTTNSSGNYTISNVNAGSYTVSASSSGYVTNSTSVNVQAGQTVTGNITLATAVTTGSITGKISNSSGTGISGATITTNPVTTTVTTNSSGNYTISNVNPGSYTVSASSSGYVTNSTSVNVQAGQAATGNITLQTQSGSFTCGTSTVTYSGKVYNTVQIGSQCWLKENLNVGTRINGTANPSNNGTIEKYCYDDNEANCNTYGGLYTWDEAMQNSTTSGTRGICPPGWHIPTNAEFQTLSSSVSNNGNALKAVGQGTGSGTGTNTSGFSALLAGLRNTNGYFVNLTNFAYFWSSTENSSTYARYIYLYYNDSNIYFNDTNKEYGFSIRCSKD